MCGGQRTVYVSEFSPSTTWAPGFEFMSSALAEAPLTSEPSLSGAVLYI